MASTFVTQSTRYALSHPASVDRCFLTVRYNSCPFLRPPRNLGTMRLLLSRSAFLVGCSTTLLPSRHPRDLYGSSTRPTSTSSALSSPSPSSSVFRTEGGTMMWPTAFRNSVVSADAARSKWTRKTPATKSDCANGRVSSVRGPGQSTPETQPVGVDIPLKCFCMTCTLSRAVMSMPSIVITRNTSRRVYVRMGVAMTTAVIP